MQPVWSRGDVSVKLSRTGKSRRFYILERSGGTEKRVTRNELKARYPTLRLPSTRKLRERQGGKDIQVTIQNNTSQDLYFGFYNRDGTYIERTGEVQYMKKEERRKNLTGPIFYWTTRQYILVGRSQDDLPPIMRLSSAGDRAARIGLNLRSTFTVSGVASNIHFD